MHIFSKNINESKLKYEERKKNIKCECEKKVSWIYMEQTTNCNDKEVAW